MAREEDKGFLVGRVYCIWETKDAIKCRMDEDGYFNLYTEFWVPQSAVHDNSEVYKMGHHGKLIVKSWWAKKQGWEDIKPEE